jgi:S1-C subfamily serine protease
MSADTDMNLLTTLSASLAGVVGAAAPSLVSVHSHRSSSSGFAWKPGLVVTANEALAEDGDVAVTLPGGQRLPAAVVGRDVTTDVALIRIDPATVPTIELDGLSPAAGTIVMAVGAQTGAPVTALGVIAVAGPAWRSMRGGEIDTRIELDLKLRRCAEGGLALNTYGQAFGMTVFGPRRNVLVIPASTIIRVAAALETHGKIPRGYLGLTLRKVRSERDDGIGAMVMSVDSTGPGAKAGIHQGDVIVSWAGKPITGVGELLRALGPASVGNKIALGLTRGGKPCTVEFVIGERSPT